MNRLCVAVLDTMWTGKISKAPRWFRINENNRSGKRLYKLINGHYHLRVTNACPYTVTSAQHHSVPDVTWLRGNLLYMSPIDLLLVCGNVAISTFHDTGLKEGKDIRKIIYMPHPAWRGWTAVALAELQERIRVTAHGQ